MKTITTLSIVTIFLLLNAAGIFGQNANGCSSGKRNGIYYTDCWTRASGVYEDGPRLQAAIDATVGKLVFNEAVYYSYQQLNLPSYITLEGLSSGSETSGSVVIHLVGEDLALFYIGPDKHGIAIRDMGFYNESAPDTDGNIAIKIQDTSGNGYSSNHFEFDNLRFKYFEEGVFVGSIHTGWQFDDAQLSNSSFEACLWAVHLDSFNANMEIHNVVINSLSDQNGIWMEKAGYVVLSYVVGNGTKVDTTVADSGTFIQIDQRSLININSTMGEGYTGQLKVSGYAGGYEQAPITITNSAFPGCKDDNSYDDSNPTVSFHNSTIISSGNFWGCYGIARPIVTGTSEVYSTGDRFCPDSPSASSLCFQGAAKSEFVLKSDDATLRGDYNADADDSASPVTEILSGIGLASRPLLALTSLDYTSPSTIDRYTYAFKQDSSNHRLTVERVGTSPTPTKTTTGYHFKGGPVQLQTATQSELSSYSVSGDSGSLLYCSDCTAPSTPCSGSGSGALALKVGSNWNCK